MSIVDLMKINLVGHSDDKDAVLDDLQRMGCLQIIPLADEAEADKDSGPSGEARDALKFLLSCPRRPRQATRSVDFDPVQIQRAASELQRRLRALADERDLLKARLRDLEPWGDFTLPPLEQMSGQRLWFYVVPHRQMAAVAATDLRWHVVNRDRRFCYVVVVAEHEPDQMPAERTRTGSLPSSVLQDRLEVVALQIEDVQLDRQRLARWCLLLARSLDHLEDLAARQHAATQTCDAQPVFALQAWVPRARLSQLRAYTKKSGMAIEQIEPDPAEQPPTLFENPKGIDAGEALVTFYMTPAYWCWDPSSVVLISFAVFFAMILSDAGYGLLLGLVLWRFWRKMGQSQGARRFRFLLALLTVSSVIYGVVVGSYFGITPGPHSFLDRFHLLDMNDSSIMMMICVIIGVVHIVLANVMNAFRYGRRPQALAPMGWAAMVAGGFFLGVGLMQQVNALTWIGGAVLAVGALLVFLFSGVGQPPLKRIVKGCLAFTQVTGAFGDVLSYLRLFALGLASASLALAFNGMAADIQDAVPGVGLLLGLLVLIVGHALNFVLGLSSGVIHGLRLNMIEFFKWGVPEEGLLYRPFKRKESAS